MESVKTLIEDFKAAISELLEDYSALLKNKGESQNGKNGN